MREFVMFALLGLVHQSTTQTCQVYYEVMPMNSITGGAAASGVADVGGCQTNCESNVDCLGFDFKPAENDPCLIITVDDAIAVDMASTHYTRQQACEFASTSERCFYDYEGQSTTTNAQLGPLRGADTVEGCLQACSTFENCGGVIINSTDTSCAVLVDTVTNYTAEMGQILYTFFNCSTVPFDTMCVTSFEQIVDMKVPNGEFIIGNNTAQACQVTCENTPGCLGFDFNIPGTSCFLTTNGATPLSADTNVDHYAFQQTCTNDFECTYRSTGAYAPPDSVAFTSAPGVVSLEECLGVCNADGDNGPCTMATFNTELNFDCRIYTVAIAQADLEMKTGLTGYTRLGCGQVTTDPPTVAPGTCIWRYEMFTNQKAQGATLLNTGSPVADCETACSGSTTCTGFDYQTTNQQCWLHTNNPYPTLTSSAGNNENHYNKYRQCGDCEFNYYPETIGGTAAADQKLIFTTENDCVLGCGADTSCRSASFNTAGSVCYFYSNDRLASSSNVMTSNHYVKTMCANDFAGCSFNYVAENDRKISGGTQVAVTPSTAEQCEVQCNARQGCFSFDFNSNNDCFLITNYNPITIEVGVMHYHLMPSCNGTDRTDCNFFATGRYWPSESGTMTSVSREDCFTSCYDGSVVGCTGIAYNNNMCHTFSSTAVWTDSSLVDSTINTLEAYRFDGCATSPTTTTVTATQTTTGTGTPTPGGCVVSTNHSPGMHASGGLPQGSVADVQACQDLCFANLDCVGFDVTTAASPQCWLHVNPNAPNNLTPMSGVDFYELVRCSSTSSASTTLDTTPIPQGCTPEYEEIVDMKKGGGTPNAANTRAACQSACEAAFTCIGFDYTAQDTCWLHSNVDANLVTPGASESVNHYLRKWRCGACLYRPYPNFNAQGGSPRAGLTTETACLVGCAADSTCFDVDFSTGSCFFFTATIPRASLDNAPNVRHWTREECDSSVTPTGVTPTGVTSTTTSPGGACTPNFRMYADNRVQGANVVPGVSDLAGCEADCAADADCQGFDFTSDATNNCWKDSTGLVLMDAQGAGIDHYRKGLQCGDCKYELIRDMAPMVAGTVRAETSRDTCLQACENDGACFAATFDSGANSCRSFGPIDRTTLVPAAGMDFYEEYDCTEECTPAYREYTDSKVSGAMRAAGVSTLPGCIDTCDASANCVGFDFTASNTCWLDNVGRTIVDAGTEGVNHFVKARECGSCSYEITPGMAPSSGGTVQGFSTVETCLGACSRGDCVAATFDTTNNECTFYQQVPASLAASTADFYEEYDCSAITPTGDTTIRGGSTTSDPAAQCVAMYDIDENNQVFGGTPVPSASTVDDCKASCEGRADCIGFDFNFDANSCWLTVSSPADLSPTNNNVDHYTLYYQCGGCRFDLMPDFGATGGNNMGGSLTFQACLLICESNANCVAVDFRNGVCSMFTTTPNPTPTPGTLHWTKGTCAGPTGTGGTTLTPVADCVPAYTSVSGQKVLNGVEQAGVSDVAGCTNACESDNFCIGFDFDSITSGCWLTVDVNGQLVPQNNNEDVTHYNRIWSCNGCSFRPFSRRGASGGATTSDTTQANCVKACSTSSGCFDATFDFGNNVCRTFATDVTPGVSGNTYQQFVHWEKDGVCPGSGTTSSGGTTSGPTPGQCVIDYIQTPDVNLPGGLSEPTVNSVAGCMSACEANVDDCIGFDFDANSICWLHGNELIGVNPGSLPGNTRYELVYVCGGCRYQPLPSRRYNGNGVVGRSESGMDACLFACNPSPFNDPTPACTNVNVLTDGACSHSNAANTVSNVIVDTASTHFVRLDCGEVQNDNGGSTAPSTTSRILSTTTLSTSRATTRSTTTRSTEAPTTAEDQTTEAPA